MWFPLRKNTRNFIQHKGKQIFYDAKNKESNNFVSSDLRRNNFYTTGRTDLEHETDDS